MEEILRARAWFYNFFANALYWQPSAERLGAFIEQNPLLAAADDEAMGEALQGVSSALQAMRDYQPEDWSRLQQEYLRLFSPAGPMLVYPWESVYLSREHILYDEHTLSVQAFMADWSLGAADSSSGPVDHIGLECSFMAVLNQQALHGLAAGDAQLVSRSLQAQEQFLTQHLLRYGEAFCMALQQQAKLAFYRDLAGLLRGWLSEDQKAAAELRRAAEASGEGQS